MSWRIKLSNWLSNGILDKYQRKIELAKTKLNQTESELESLKIQLQQSQLEQKQTLAQLQINQGFQIELAEKQIQLQQIKAQLHQCQSQLQQKQEQLENSQTQLQQTQTKLVNSQDWLQQIQTPIKILEVKRLPQKDFEALWGFGIGSPVPQSQAIAGSILFKGWVLGKKSPAKKVRITYQGQMLIETPVEQSRPTITEYYPDIPAAANSGFETPFSITAMGSEAELELQAVLEDASVIPISIISLKR
ncbi:hypothetical protein Sta7437_2733 [Stanieria cyanosphaera PCC 7437]|uniref:Chromosome segregation ATPase-like protein n=1 Tax=Stanieria cyanosphaera (strain ATCC 29371 / PCC 7437) TaxID=111780 RepID=K9XUP3_STAC7|nr:hypothetical protein [Stanieria cyanosphaera]AFZ36258.1 hypothetical protein Sta7437_2733 [Stanieria cyanosphaera PCC 7437]